MRALSRAPNGISGVPTPIIMAPVRQPSPSDELMIFCLPAFIGPDLLHPFPVCPAFERKFSPYWVSEWLIHILSSDVGLLSHISLVAGPTEGLFSNSSTYLSSAYAHRHTYTQKPSCTVTNSHTHWLTDSLNTLINSHTSHTHIFMYTHLYYIYSPQTCTIHHTRALMKNNHI